MCPGPNDNLQHVDNSRRQPSSTENWRGSTSTLLAKRRPHYHLMAAPESKKTHSSGMLKNKTNQAGSALRNSLLLLCEAAVKRNSQNPLPQPPTLLWTSELLYHLKSPTFISVAETKWTKPFLVRLNTIYLYLWHKLGIPYDENIIYSKKFKDTKNSKQRVLTDIINNVAFFLFHVKYLDICANIMMYTSHEVIIQSTKIPHIGQYWIQDAYAKEGSSCLRAVLRKQTPFCNSFYDVRRVEIRRRPRNSARRMKAYILHKLMIKEETI